jgi:hypothetical protein
MIHDILPTAEQSLRMCAYDDFCESLREFWPSTGAERVYWRKRLRFAVAVERKREQETRAIYAAAAASRKVAA